MIFQNRYALNVKELPFKTVWIEYPDVASTVQSIGGKPTGKWRHDGSDKYTLPVIYDPNTSTVVSESLEIARYLEKTYPNRGNDLFKGQSPLHAAFEHLMETTSIPHILRLCGVLVGKNLLNEASHEYWWRFRALDIGMPLTDFCPKTVEDAAKVWEDLKKGQDKLAVLYETDQVLIGGDKPVYADCIMAGWWAMIKASYGTESAQWKAVSEWHGGKWVKIMDAMKQYEGQF